MVCHIFILLLVFAGLLSSDYKTCNNQIYSLVELIFKKRKLILTAIFSWTMSSIEIPVLHTVYIWGV